MTQQRAFANHERQQQAQRISKLGRSTVLLLATVLSFGTLGLLAADQLYRPDTFVIDQLKIKGKFRHLDPLHVEETVKKLQVGNFFSIELMQIKSAIEQLQWVQNADVRREWPNTLLIQIDEHRPVMRWGKGQWINSLGQVISLPEELEFDSKVTLYGNEKDAQLMLHTAVRWQRQLAGKGLELTAVILSGSHAWTLRLQDLLTRQTFDLLLGRDDVEHRLARFEFLFADRLKRPDLQLHRVDARYPDGLAVSASTIENDPQLAIRQSNATFTDIQR